MATDEVVDYKPESSWASDFAVLKSMFLSPVTESEDQKEQLESFYKNQAVQYDSYRHRMLFGRQPMIKAMKKPKGGVWVDMGGGTGSNMEFFKDINWWGKVVILDLCPSLAKVAEDRIKGHGWTNCEAVVADACDFSKPMPDGSVDVVTFSYALSMIPDWQKAIRNAFRMLKVGGQIAVCDFTVSKDQWPGMSALWTNIFKQDHVHLNAEHQQFLQKCFLTVEVGGGYGTFPYVPGVMQCPYYFFVGTKVTREFPL
jgi:S-adenosylmethionine-diacylgycerolhomoserine-N-methlytransferase